MGGLWRPSKFRFNIRAEAQNEYALPALRYSKVAGVEQDRREDFIPGLCGKRVKASQIRSVPLPKQTSDIFDQKGQGPDESHTIEVFDQ
jgi:hypothetical protein